MCPADGQGLLRDLPALHVANDGTRPEHAGLDLQNLVRPSWFVRESRSLSDFGACACIDYGHVEYSILSMVTAAQGRSLERYFLDIHGAEVIERIHRALAHTPFLHRIRDRDIPGGESGGIEFLALLARLLWIGVVAEGH